MIYYCSETCQNMASTEYQVQWTTAMAEKMLLFNKFQDYCDEFSPPLNFPLLIAKLFAKALKEVRLFGTLNTFVPLKNLAHVAIKPSMIPGVWKSEYEHFGRNIVIDPVNLAYFNLEWYTWMQSILAVNCFAINVGNCGRREPGGSDVICGGAGMSSTEGTGLFLSASKFNHSCDPNTAVSFPYNAELHATALRDIRENEEITISYIDLDWPFAQRQTFLYSKYGFWCTCARCKKP